MKWLISNEMANEKEMNKREVKRKLIICGNEIEEWENNVMKVMAKEK